MKLQLPFNTQSISTIAQLASYVSSNFQKIQAVLNGNFSFGDNIPAKVDLLNNCATSLITITFKSATTVGVAHTLGAVPRGYIQVGSTVAASLSAGNQANTTTTIYLASSAAATMKVLVF